MVQICFIKKKKEKTQRQCEKSILILNGYKSNLLRKHEVVRKRERDDYKDGAAKRTRKLHF
jgi:hypothetical protein